MNFQPLPTKPFTAHPTFFKDRTDAGQKLARLLVWYKDKPVVVYGLPRGGVPVAYEVAAFLQAPLDLIIVKKISHPAKPEFAIGAIAISGHSAHNRFNKHNMIDIWSTPKDRAKFSAQQKKAQKEAVRQRQLYLCGYTPIPLHNKTAIIVDDGLATGLTMQAAIKEIRHGNPAAIVVAVPVAPIDIARVIAAQIDKLYALITPQKYFHAVSQFYKNFRQVTDSEVLAALKDRPS